MTEYDRRAGLPSASFAQFCLELLVFVASHPALRDASRDQQASALDGRRCRDRSS